MNERFEIVTFDCYGTLIDWESGIHEAFQKAAGSRLAVSKTELLERYHRIEPEIERDGSLPYREVLRRVAEALLDELDVRDVDSSFLPESLPEWKPFPDTNDALELMVRSGLALAILSNTDRELLDATMRHFPIAFEFTIVAGEIGSYKPAHGHWLEAKPRVGSRRWLHAAQSWFHDIVPARELGIPSAWVNRKHEPRDDRGAPLLEVATLGDLASALTLR